MVKRRRRPAAAPLRTRRTQKSVCPASVRSAARWPRRSEHASCRTHRIGPSWAATPFSPCSATEWTSPRSSRFCIKPSAIRAHLLPGFPVPCKIHRQPRGSRLANQHGATDEDVSSRNDVSGPRFTAPSLPSWHCAARTIRSSADRLPFQ